MSSSPSTTPSYLPSHTLISPSTLAVDDDEKQRRIHFTDGHNTNPPQLAHSCFPFPILLQNDPIPTDLSTKQHYRLLLQQLQRHLQSLFGIRTNHCSTRSKPHFDPRLKGYFIPRLCLEDRRLLILWCSNCEGNYRFSPICQIRFTKQSYSSGTDQPSITILSLFYHQCSHHRKPTGDILSNDGFVMQPFDYKLIVGSLFNPVLQKLETYTPPLPMPSPILTPEEERLLQRRINSSHLEAPVILPTHSTPFHHWDPPMVRTDHEIPHHQSHIYHRTSGSLLAPFHPLEFTFDGQHYLSFTSRFGLYLSSMLGITDEFSPFHFDIVSYQQESLFSSTTPPNISKFFIPNPKCHLTFRGFSLLLGGDELISFSPWKQYGEGFHVDVAPRHILRNIPTIENLMVPFSTIIPLGFDYNEYTVEDFPHRSMHIHHPNNPIKIVFGNVLFMAGDTIHQETTNIGDSRGLHPSLIGLISSSIVEHHLSISNVSIPPIDPPELTPLNTLSLDIHLVKNFIISQKRHLLDFLKCAIPHIVPIKINSEDPHHLPSSAQFRECYDFLHDCHEYLFPLELSLSRNYFSDISQHPHSSTHTHSTPSTHSAYPKKFDSLQQIEQKPNLSLTQDDFTSGRVPFLDTGSFTYIRGLDLESFLDDSFRHYFETSDISWKLYDVSGNGNCGFYVHQCHLELHKMHMPMTATEFRKDLYQFAVNEFQQMKSANEWWTYFGYPKNQTNPKRVEKLNNSTKSYKKLIKQRLIGRKNFDNGCSLAHHMSVWEHWLLIHRFKYDAITFDTELQEFSHTYLDQNNCTKTRTYNIKTKHKLIPSWSAEIFKKLKQDPKSVMVRRFVQLNSSNGSEIIGHFQWLLPVIRNSTISDNTAITFPPPNHLKRSSSSLEL